MLTLLSMICIRVCVFVCWRGAEEDEGLPKDGVIGMDLAAELVVGRHACP